MKPNGRREGGRLGVSGRNAPQMHPILGNRVRRPRGMHDSGSAAAHALCGCCSAALRVPRRTFQPLGIASLNLDLHDRPARQSQLVAEMSLAHDFQHVGRIAGPAEIWTVAIRPDKYAPHSTNAATLAVPPAHLRHSRRVELARSRFASGSPRRALRSASLATAHPIPCAR